MLKAGAEVYEYQAAMIHAKVLCVDDLWVVVGSTNFDNRSFGINDEVNLAIRDHAVAARFEHDMALDLEQSRRVSLEEWQTSALHGARDRADGFSIRATTMSKPPVTSELPLITRTSAEAFTELFRRIA